MWCSWRPPSRVSVAGSRTALGVRPSGARRVVVVGEVVNRQAEFREEAGHRAAAHAVRVPVAVGQRESTDVAVVVSGRVDPARAYVRPSRHERGDAQLLVAGRTCRRDRGLQYVGVGQPTPDAVPTAAKMPTRRPRTHFDSMCPPHPFRDLGVRCDVRHRESGRLESAG